MKAADTLVKWLLLSWVAYVLLSVLFAEPPRPLRTDAPSCKGMTLDECIDADFQWMKAKGLL